METVIAFGQGAYYKKYHSLLSHFQVLGVSDNQEKNASDYPFIHVNDILQMRADRIIIFNKNSIGKIFDQLMALGVAADRIFTVRQILFELYPELDVSAYMKKDFDNILSLAGGDGISRESNSAVIRMHNCDIHITQEEFTSEPDSRALFYVWTECAKYSIFYQFSKSQAAAEFSSYVVTHKEAGIPAGNFKIINAGADFHVLPSYIPDNTGDNISYLNEKINECTAMYWIWKHDLKSDIIGISHYRRFLLNDDFMVTENIISKKGAASLLDKYDVLAARHLEFSCPFREQMIIDHVDAEALDRGLSLLRDELKKSQPEYLAAFEEVFSGNIMFPCNLMIMRREFYDQYCDFLFSIIIPAAERFETAGLDPRSKRTIGFLAERLFTVFIHKNRLKVYECPMLVTEE